MYFNFTTDLTANEGPPPTRGNLVLTVISPLLAIAILVVTSRIFVKAKLGKLGLEDVLIVLSTVGGILFSVVVRVLMAIYR